ncbi:MAG TPA: hypothetical protein VGH43_18875 [Jatrophihabitans sp.]|jgi:hypothetical protein
MRVYLPATSTVLRQLLDARELAPGQTAFAVTPALREWYVDDDIEELEYAALLEAARASLRLLDANAEAARRRVVIAIDAPDAAVEIRDDLDRGVVRLGEVLPLAAVASVHVDDAEAGGAVTAAAQAITAADLGDESAQERVDDAEGFDLSWYASQEIADLLAAL